MPTFGFSAFLKLLSLSYRRQGSELRTRLQPSAGGYDFHRRFRRLAGRYLADGESLEALFDATTAFGNPAEQRAARAGLQRLEAWRRDFPGSLKAFAPKVFEAPRGRFKVHFTPDFGIEIDGVWVAVHIWNTASPDLDVHMTHAALALFPHLYSDDADPPHDLAVLSIPDNQLYRLSDVDDHWPLAMRVVAGVENRVDEINEEDRPPPPPPPSDQPRR